MSDDEHDDEKFDGWLREAAQGYNRPPMQVPRDEMWAAIQSARAATASAGAIVPTRGGAPRWAPRLWQMAAAAILFLGSGIWIGRGLGPGSSDRTATVAVAPGADEGGGVELSPMAPASPARAAGRERDAGERSAPGTSGGARAGEIGGGDVYAVATVDHLARAEALLTSFKGAANDSTDMSLERWARDLLADTRLLLDSPAATDTRRRHLLEDLELVLAQIVQLRAESSADRHLVRRSIERGEVLTRIRSTIPAGSASGV